MAIFSALTDFRAEFELAIPTRPPKPDPSDLEHIDDDFAGPFHMALNGQQHPQNHAQESGPKVKHRVALGLANPLYFALHPDRDQWGQHVAATLLLPYTSGKLV